jgi:hypothetical protein
MATVTVTEILGGDNIAASRPVINSNFLKLQNAINTLETRLNTSYVPGGSLNVGDVQVLKYTRPVTTNIFLCQASGQFDGNLGIGTATTPGTLAVLGGITASQALAVAAGITFSNTSGTSIFTNLARTTTNDAFSNQQWYAAGTKNPLVDVQAVAGSLAAAITQSTNVLYLDVSAVTAGNEVLTLPAPGTLSFGQIVTLTIDSASGLTAAALTFEIDNSAGFDTAFDNTTLGANIVLNTSLASDTDNQFLGIWITLLVSSTGWKVIGAHPDCTIF